LSAKTEESIDLSHELLKDTRLHVVLLKIDEDFAAATRAAGCPCGGALHYARYPRKPRGVPDPFARAKRLSFCCAEDGCRKRARPPSVRFLGRKVYAAAVVMIGTAMSHGLAPKRVAWLRELLGVSRPTLERWRAWWRETFVATAHWRAERTRFTPPVSAAALPCSFVERFWSGDEQDRLVSALRFVAPVRL
jgi:hypothetical protein